MLCNRLVRLAIAAAFLCPRAVGAETIVLDYKTTIALASQRGPSVLAARGGVAEARGRRSGAAVRVAANPDVSINAGPRFVGGDRSTDLEISVGQTFELGGQRSARLGAADAGIAQAEARADDARRLAVRDAGLAYYRALAAEEQVRLATDVESAASDVAITTERRLAKGDALDLDVSLAKATQGRARAALRAAQADREAAQGALRAILGIESSDKIEVTGDLTTPRTYDLAELLAAAPTRPDLLQLAAESDEGAALVRLGETLGWPDVRVGLSYLREERAEIVLGGLVFTLPVFERGQEHRQVGRAKIKRADAVTSVLRRSIDAEVRAAFATYQKRTEVVAEFKNSVIPRLDESDTALSKSYQAGVITLAAYLAARRELLDARTEYLARLLEMAFASVELEAVAGVLR
jgi:outer membrane protein, heavy metal efflux system